MHIKHTRPLLHQHASATTMFPPVILVVIGVSAFVVLALAGISWQLYRSYRCNDQDVEKADTSAAVTEDMAHVDSTLSSPSDLEKGIGRSDESKQPSEEVRNPPSKAKILQLPSQVSYSLE